jgi:hypothetical protein
MNKTEDCNILQFADLQSSEDRVSELSSLVHKACPYYQGKFGDSYAEPLFGTAYPPYFFFHTGDNLINRYNNGFISASQEKFATYKNILPLIHEIGHRWLGEYTIFAKDGMEGYAFIIESLNEFMVWQFARETLGTERYDKIIADAQKEVETLSEKSLGNSVLSVTKNTDYDLTYILGPLILHEYSASYGYDSVINTIVDFYHNTKFKEDVTIDDFFESCRHILGDEITNRSCSDLSKPR